MRDRELLEDFSIFKKVAASASAPGIMVALDLETTIVDGSPSPFDGAKIVALGEFDGVVANTTTADYPLFAGQILVGHNIKFDLVHLLKAQGVRWVTDYLRRFSAVIDTSINEYILSGHVHAFPSLKECADKYGVAMLLKDTLKEDYWDKGLGADHVPQPVLFEYLESDVRATHAVACSQLKTASSRELSHFFVQGWATVVYAIMEYHGLHFDKYNTDKLLAETKDQEAKLHDLVVSFMHAVMPWVKGTHDTITNRALSTVLFGEPGLPIKTKVIIGKYKNGKPKTKTVTATVTPGVDERMKDFPISRELKLNDNLGYPVNDSVLEDFHEMFKSHPEGKVASLVRRWRGLSKLSGTYLQAIIDEDYEMHPTIHQTVTATGRTSSSKPNVQNQPPEVRRMVGKDGYKVASFDFSQLELWAAAQLSRDPVMLRDVQTSDVHYEVGKDIYGWHSPSDMDKETRRKIKGINFGYIYGGGANTLAKQSGVPVATVKRIIKRFKERYPTYTEWCEENIKNAAHGPTSSPKVEAGGYVSYNRMWLSPSGRSYQFREMFDKFSGTWTVSPSQVKNYPVQGFATGDYVPLFLVKMFLYTGALGVCEPFAAVHDSASMYLTSAVIYGSLQALADHTSTTMPRLCQELYDVHLSFVPKIEWEIDNRWA